MGAEVWGPLSSSPLWCPGNAGWPLGILQTRRMAGEGSSVTSHEQIMQCDSEGLRGAVRGCRDPCTEGNPPCRENVPRSMGRELPEQGSAWAGSREGTGGWRCSWLRSAPQKLPPAVGGFCSAPAPWDMQAAHHGELSEGLGLVARWKKTKF